MSPDPSSAPAGRRATWLAAIGLAALLGGILFFRLGDDLPMRSHEALLAETARNMVLDRPVTLADGSRPNPWLIPNFDDLPRLRKTPLPYWTVASLAYLTGHVDEWTARLPSAAAALGTALIMMALLRRRYDRPTAFLGGAILATTEMFLQTARMALSDMPMTFFTTASLAALWMAVETLGRRRFAWLVLAGAAAGLAMMAKGPVPAVIFFAPYAVAAVIMVVRLVRDRREGRPVGREWAWAIGGVIVAKLVFFLIVAPWPLYVWYHVPQAVEIWKVESVDRSTGEFGHREAPYFYLLRLPFFVAPWTVFFFYGVALAVARLRREAAERPWLLFVGAWLLGPLAAFSIAAGKQDHYLLPIIPACAVFMVLALRHLLTATDSPTQHAARRLLVGHAVAVFVIGVAAAAVGLGLLAAPSLITTTKIPPAFVRPEVTGAVAVMGGLLIAGGLVAWVLARRQKLAGSLIALLAVFAAAYLWAWPMLHGPLDRSNTAADFGRQVAQRIPPDARLCSYMDSNNTVIYYAGRPMMPLPGLPYLETEMARGQTFYLMCSDRYRPQLKDVPGLVPLIHEEDPGGSGDGFWLFRYAGEP